jgi:hypothetical protein
MIYTILLILIYEAEDALARRMMGFSSMFALSVVNGNIANCSNGHGEDATPES